MTADRRLVNCAGDDLVMAGKRLTLPCIVRERMIPDVEVIVGTDVLKHFGCALDYGKFSICASAAAMSSNPVGDGLIVRKTISDGKKWVTKWVWKREPGLNNHIDTTDFTTTFKLDLRQR